MLALSMRRGGEQGVKDLYPVDQLRRIMVWIGVPASSVQFVIDRPASLWRPDPQWMRDFARFIDVPGHGLDSYFQRLEREAGEVSSHQLLGDWSISYERALGKDPIALNRPHILQVASLMPVLRGDNPELRPAILHALRSVVSRQEDATELARIAWPLLPIRPADLDPSAFRLTGSRSLIQLIEYVDRSGVMGDFLAEVSAAQPGSRLIHQVSEAFSTWDATNRRLLSALAEDVLGHHDS